MGLGVAEQVGGESLDRAAAESAVYKARARRPRAVSGRPALPAEARPAARRGSTAAGGRSGGRCRRGRGGAPRVWCPRSVMCRLFVISRHVLPPGFLPWSAGACRHFLVT